jgi:hypothetical protein
MELPKFVIVRNADINPDVTDKHYEVALQTTQKTFFIVAIDLTQDEANLHAEKLNKLNQYNFPSMAL